MKIKERSKKIAKHFFSDIPEALFAFVVAYIITVVLTHVFLVTEETELKSWVKYDYVYILQIVLFIIIKVLLASLKEKLIENTFDTDSRENIL